jgi:purine catabolism regulator
VDTPDVEGWVFGGEFLLTSGYLFRDCPERLGDLVEMSGHAGVAALGVKIGRFIERIPRDVIRTAERLDFPLIGIPFHYAHTDIIKSLIDAIAENQLESRRISEERNRLFIDELLNAESVEEVLSSLRGHIHGSIMFLRATGERFLLSDSDEFSRAAANLPVHELTDHFPHEVIRGRSLIQQSSGSAKPEGYLFFDRPAGDGMNAALVDYAKKTLRLHLWRDNERRKAERDAATQFVQDILYKRFKHASEIQGKARELGWEMKGRHTVAFARIRGDGESVRISAESHVAAYESCRMMINATQTGGVPCALLGDGMAFIVKAPVEGWGKSKRALTGTFAKAYKYVLNNTGASLAFGVGSAVDDLLECDKSLREARRAAAMTGDNENEFLLHFWEDMGIYKLLSPIFDTREALDFQREHLGALIEHSEKSGKNNEPRDFLLQTLFFVIRNNWRLKPVAAAMNLHYNTVKYRYRKIGEILRVNLESRDARINLTLAMELYMLNRPPR